jgi:thioredoxin 1
MKKNEVQEISEPEFGAEVLRSMQPALVGFLAGWSKPCQLVEPVLEEVAEANVDDNPDLGTFFGIQSVPTLIYFVNGVVRAKIVGMASPKAILAKLQSIAQANTPTKEPGRQHRQ